MISPGTKIVYYRLKMVDLDGKFAYSKIIALKLNGSFSTDNVSVYPNPFITDIKVQLTATEDHLAAFRVISFDGREVINRKISVQKGDNIVVLKDFGSMATGNYILEITTNNNKYIQKILKK